MLDIGVSRYLSTRALRMQNPVCLSLKFGESPALLGLSRAHSDWRRREDTGRLDVSILPIIARENLQRFERTRLRKLNRELTLPSTELLHALHRLALRSSNLDQPRQRTCTGAPKPTTYVRHENRFL